MTAASFDPLVKWYWVALGLFFVGFYLYIVVAEREYWKGFRDGKRLGSNEHKRVNQ